MPCVEWDRSCGASAWAEARSRSTLSRSFSRRRMELFDDRRWEPPACTAAARRCRDSPVAALLLHSGFGPGYIRAPNAPQDRICAAEDYSPMDYGGLAFKAGTAVLDCDGRASRPSAAFPRRRRSVMSARRVHCGSSHRSRDCLECGPLE